MISTVRASIKLVLFFLLSFITVVLVAVGNLLIAGISEKKAVAWKNLIIGNWASATASLLGITIKVKGTPPNASFFLVCNHLSYIDVVPLWKYLNATFVAKSEISSWPFFGWGTRTLGVLFIDRDLKRDVYRMNNRISEIISKEQGLILFPEGTSTKGEKVVSFNSPLLEYPAQKKMPVNFASITYRSNDSTQPVSKTICWWGDMAFFPHFWNMLKMRGFEAEITFGEYTVTASDRKELAQKLHEAVSEAFVSTSDKENNLDSIKGI